MSCALVVGEKVCIVCVSKNIPAHGIAHIQSNCLIGKTYAQLKVLFQFRFIQWFTCWALRNLSHHHGQVSKCIHILLILLETSFKALSSMLDILFLPVHMSQSIPSFSFSWHQLYGLGEVLLSLLGVLRQEVHALAFIIQNVCLFFLIFNQIQWLLLQKSQCSVNLRFHYLVSIFIKINSIKYIKLFS
jgi:hypothetical protein